MQSIFREVQVEMIISYSYALTRMAKHRVLATLKPDKDTDLQELSFLPTVSDFKIGKVL